MPGARGRQCHFKLTSRRKDGGRVVRKAITSIAGRAEPADQAVMKGIRIIAITVSVLASIGSVAFADEDTDALLVLAADVSYSVNAAKFNLQRVGYAKAITNRRVVHSMTSGVSGRIAACFFEWSGESWQDLVVDWTLIDSVDAAERFAYRILHAPRPFPERTSISAAINFALLQLSRSPFRSSRRIIDISGDGDNNAGPDVSLARDEAVLQGVTINGLVILSEDVREHTSPSGGLDQYYRRNVIGGVGSFVIVSHGLKSFEDSLSKKIIIEIARHGSP